MKKMIAVLELEKVLENRKDELKERLGEVYRKAAEWSGNSFGIDIALYLFQDGELAIFQLGRNEWLQAVSDGTAMEIARKSSFDVLDSEEWSGDDILLSLDEKEERPRFLAWCEEHGKDVKWIDLADVYEWNEEIADRIREEAKEEAISQYGHEWVTETISDLEEEVKEALAGK